MNAPRVSFSSSVVLSPYVVLLENLSTPEVERNSHCLNLMFLLPA